MNPVKRNELLRRMNMITYQKERRRENTSPSSKDLKTKRNCEVTGEFTCLCCTLNK